MNAWPRQLFHPEQLVSGKEDAANNYARGHYTAGKVGQPRRLARYKCTLDIERSKIEVSSCLSDSNHTEILVVLLCLGL